MRFCITNWKLNADTDNEAIMAAVAARGPVEARPYVRHEEHTVNARTVVSWSEALNAVPFVGTAEGFINAIDALEEGSSYYQYELCRIVLAQAVIAKTAKCPWQLEQGRPTRFLPMTVINIAALGRSPHALAIQKLARNNVSPVDAIKACASIQDAQRMAGYDWPCGLYLDLDEAQNPVYTSGSGTRVWIQDQEVWIETEGIDSVAWRIHDILSNQWEGVEQFMPLASL